MLVTSCAASHLWPVLYGRGLTEIVDHILPQIKDWDFALVACSGTSGCLIAPLIATMLDKGIVVVRKNSDQRNSCHDEENWSEERPMPYIFVDDLISSGRTCERVLDRLGRNHCIGVILYNQSCTCDPPGECVQQILPEHTKLVIFDGNELLGHRN